MAELYPIGALVMVTPYTVFQQRPFRGIVRGYDMGKTKYRVGAEYLPGLFNADGLDWPFLDQVELIDAEYDEAAHAKANEQYWWWQELSKVDLLALREVGQMYLGAIDADPEHELLTAMEAIRVTEVRMAVEKLERLLAEGGEHEAKVAGTTGSGQSGHR